MSSWYARAACSGQAPAWDAPDGRVQVEDAARMRAAVAVCRASCTVTAECAAARPHGAAGVWGGVWHQPHQGPGARVTSEAAVRLFRLVEAEGPIAVSEARARLGLSCEGVRRARLALGGRVVYQRAGQRRHVLRLESMVDVGREVSS
ncbi:MAG: WhiB family transcriptional regulator [Phycicoccus sp.]